MNSAPHIVLCDVDGTLSSWDHRPRLMGDIVTTMEYVAWHKLCVSDPAIERNLMLLRALYEAGYRIDLVTARPDECRVETMEWLDRHGVPYAGLLMRPMANSVDGAQIKREWAIGRYTPQQVLLVLDDEETCVQMWRAEGYHVLHTRSR